jgi:hypothetical protein
VVGSDGSMLRAFDRQREIAELVHLLHQLPTTRHRRRQRRCSRRRLGPRVCG